MNFSLVDLQSFVTVSEQASFQTAAKLLCISQPALSRRISKLEQSVGARLLERSTRSVALSAVGREFLPMARRVLDELEASMTMFAREEGLGCGQFNIACLPTVANSFLPETLRRLREKHPGVRVRIIDEVANIVMRAVLEGDADLGITLSSSREADVVFTPLFEDRFVVACRKDHPLAEKETIPWSDLANHTFIRAGRLNGNSTIVDQTLSQLRITPRWGYEVQHLSTSLGLIRAGLGFTVMSRMSVAHRPYPEIVFRHLEGEKPGRSIGLIQRKRAHLSPAALAFREVVLGMTNDDFEKHC